MLWPWAPILASDHCTWCCYSAKLHSPTHHVILHVWNGKTITTKVSAMKSLYFPISLLSPTLSKKQKKPKGNSKIFFKIHQHNFSEPPARDLMQIPGLLKLSQKRAELFSRAFTKWIQRNFHNHSFIIFLIFPGFWGHVSVSLK